MSDQNADSVCATCGGRIHLSTVGSGFNSPVYVHDNNEDWANDPHNVTQIDSSEPAS